MKVKIINDANEIALQVSESIIELINSTPQCVLGLATGSSPVETYRKLIKACKAGKVSFKSVSTYNLDEYCSLSENNPNSYRFFMNEKLFNHVDIQDENVHFPNVNAADIDGECENYSKELRRAKIDLQLLGIGRNGHIGFNEPAHEFSDITHKVKLEKSTIDANKRFFSKNEAVPEFAITMGIGDIMTAERIALIATGESKARAIKAMIEGPLDPQCPASVLQRHKDVTLFLDSAAASLLETF